MSEARPFHVLIDIGGSRSLARLREIEAWFAEWQMDAEVGSVLGESGQLWARFADAADEYLYDRLARTYPD